MSLKLWYSAKELAGLVGLPSDIGSVIRRAKKLGWTRQRRAGKGGGWEYHIDSLPEITRLALLPTETMLPSTTDPNLPMVTPKGQALPIKPCGANAKPLTEEQKRKACGKYELVRLYVATLAAAGRKRKAQAREEFITLYNDAGGYPAVLALVGRTAWQTIEGWKRTLRETGDPYSLADTRGTVRKGQSSLTVEQMSILSTFAHHPNKLKPSHAVRWARLVMKKHGIDTMSSATYVRYIEKLRRGNYPLWVFCREGEQAMEDKCGYTLQRDWGKIQVGDLLTADGHVMNFTVINPATGKPCRPTLILWYDCKSNYPLGWELMPTENTAAIHAALRRAIIALGKLPQVAYLDNGRAFRGKHFTAAEDFDNGVIAGLYARMGIAVTFAWPYHGQAKTVERFFGTLLELESILPTYCGNSIDNKPARMHRGESLHRRLWAKHGGNEIAISLEQAHEIIAAWFDDYATRPQRGHLNGKCPLELFQTGRGPGVDQLELAELMMSVKVSTITKNGIQMFGRYYYEAPIYGRVDPVLVRYDRQDQSQILVYELSGEFLCRALPKTGVHPAAKHLGTEEDVEILQQEIRTKQRIKSLTVGPARKLLNDVIMPEVQENLAQLGMLEGFSGGARKQLPAPEKIIKLDKEKFAREVAEGQRLQAEAQANDFRDGLLALDASDRFEKLLELEAQGEELAEEWSGYMTFFLKTPEYLNHTEYWEQRRMAFALMYGNHQAKK